MKCEELKNKFFEFLICYSNDTTEHNVNYALDELFELADRQWNTYELIDSEVKCQVEKYIMSIIDFENEEAMEPILCIIPRLGLKNLFQYLLEKKIILKMKM